MEGDASGYVAYQVLPTFEVDHQRGTYPVIPLGEMLRNADVKRNNKSGYNRVDWNFSEAEYACREYGVEGPVDERAKNAYADYFDAEVETARIIRSLVLREAEKRVAEKVFNPTTFSGQATAITNEWDDIHTSDADPIGDVNDAVNAIYDRTGVWANALVVNRKVFRNLRRLDAIKESIESGGVGDPTKASDITPAMLARVFDLDQVIVAGGTRNMSNKGQEADPEQIWSSEYAMVTRIATAEGFGEPCLGRTFHWSQDGSMPRGTVETYREEAIRGDVVRVRHDVDEKLLYAEVSQLLSNITTTA